MVYLPDELWLHILSFVPPAVIWTNCLLTNRQLYRIGEAYAKDELLPRFKLSHTMSLSSGPHHRWYDIWGTINFHSPKLQPCPGPCIGSPSAYALFSQYETSPKKLEERTLLKWRTTASSRSRASDRLNECKIQFEDEGMKIEKLERIEFLDVEVGCGLWVDWRLLLDQYWGRSKGV